MLTEARALAVEQATAKARQYADATGQVLSLKEVRATQPRAYPGFRRGFELRGVMDAARASSVPIRAGEENLSVTVQVMWSFD